MVIAKVSTLVSKALLMVRGKRRPGKHLSQATNLNLGKQTCCIKTDYSQLAFS